MTEMRARLVDKDGNPLGTASNPLKISGDVGGGVPDGGTTGQVLQKKSDADQDVEWGDGSGSSTAWGSITGTLSDQTDLNMALGGKVPTTRTVNSKALSDDISLTASDVGAATTADITYENLNANGDVGTTSGTVCAGDDSRLSDSRTPTSHGNEAHSSIYLTEIAWGDITGTLSDQTDLGNVLDGKIAATDVTYENLNANGDVGSVSGTVCAGDDSRLSDSRTPTSHGNEAHSSAFLSAIDIHGTTEETTPATNMELLVYDPSVPANRRMTRANFLDGISAVGAFTDLTDTPASYEGYDETYYVRVNAASNALEFATVPSSYTLPTASADTLGGVKIGSGINITDGVISVTGGSGGGSELTFASGETEVTLPGTPSNGQIYEYVGTGDVWTITANAGQTIRLLGDTGNTLTAEHPYACVGLVFFNNVWIVRTQVGTLDLSTV